MLSMLHNLVFSFIRSCVSLSDGKCVDHDCSYLSHRGTALATASGDGTVKVWDFVNACCAATFSDHAQAVWGVSYHDSGDFLISCSMDHTAKLWDLVRLVLA